MDEMLLKLSACLHGGDRKCVKTQTLPIIMEALATGLHLLAPQAKMANDRDLKDPDELFIFNPVPFMWYAPKSCVKTFSPLLMRQITTLWSREPLANMSESSGWNRTCGRRSALSHGCVIHDPKYKTYHPRCPGVSLEHFDALSGRAVNNLDRMITTMREATYAMLDRKRFHHFTRYILIYHTT